MSLCKQHFVSRTDATVTLLNKQKHMMCCCLHCGLGTLYCMCVCAKMKWLVCVYTLCCNLPEVLFSYSLDRWLLEKYLEQLVTFGALGFGLWLLFKFQTAFLVQDTLELALDFNNLLKNLWFIRIEQTFSELLFSHRLYMTLPEA